LFGCAEGASRRTWSRIVVWGVLLTSIVVVVVFLVRSVQRERAFAEVWVQGDRGDQAGEYLASCSLAPEEIDRLIDVFPMCYTVEASERIGQLLDRSGPAGWRTSPQAVRVADKLVTAIENMLNLMTKASKTELDEDAFAREHSGIRPNEADRSTARGKAAWSLERSGITPTRVEALVTGLGYVGAESPAALRCLKERLTDQRMAVCEAPEKALQRLGKPVNAAVP
jgi:hypothetical protein